MSPFLRSGAAAGLDLDCPDAAPEPEPSRERFGGSQPRRQLSIAMACGASNTAAQAGFRAGRAFLCRHCGA